MHPLVNGKYVLHPTDEWTLLESLYTTSKGNGGKNDFLVEDVEVSICSFHGIEANIVTNNFRRNEMKVKW